MIHKSTTTFIFLAASIVFSIPAYADFTGIVVGVADGDTITVLRDHEQVRVRLAEIDAPEKAQPFGKQSKQILVTLVNGKEVRVVEQGQDRYKRTVGRVYQDELDVGAEQVKKGMAWVYLKYSNDETLLPIEKEAKEQKLGLWADDDPTPPWVWRRAKKGH